ncbi:MAG: hypothetical protein Q8R28_18175 [Dehalococcoidia bacterium]|nr:hypothetical protein [Dehalococcoidia bacterium]
MPTVATIERNYFGVTLYVTTRTGRQYACKAVTWLPVGRQLLVQVQSWPGYGSYRGTVTLSPEQKAAFFAAQEMTV